MKTKKLLSLSLIFIFMFNLFSCFSVYAKDEITVMVDNQKLNFDVPPEIVNGRTMVPFRLIFEALGAKISYDASTSQVTAERLWEGNPEDADPNKYVVPAYAKLKIGSKTMETVKDKKIQKVSLDVAPYIKNGRTLVPVRAISESFGADVYWDDATRTVNIYSNNFFYGGTVWHGTNESSSDILRVDTYHFYHGDLYFSFTKKTNAMIQKFATDYIWNGLSLSEGRIFPVENALAFDKVSNRVLYYVDKDYQEDKVGFTNTTEYRAVDLSGMNSELLTVKKNQGFWNKDGHTAYSKNDLLTLDVRSNPEFWGFLDDNDNATSTLKEPGVYTYDGRKGEEHPFFVSNFRNGFNNVKQYGKQLGAKIEGYTLYYPSALDGSTKSVEIPAPKFWGRHIDIVLQTPRYIFVKALVYESRNTYFNRLYAFDRFEEKLSPIMTITADLDNTGFKDPLSSSTQSSSSSTSHRTCSYCFGKGSKECSVCDGSGKVKKYTFYERTVSCPGCNGRGKKKCTVCGGDGNSAN